MTELLRREFPVGRELAVGPALGIEVGRDEVGDRAVGEFTLQMSHLTYHAGL